MRHKPLPRRQQGVVLLAFTVVMTMIVVMSVTAILANVSADTLAEITRQKQAWVDRAAAELATFYRLHPDSMDKTDSSKWATGEALADAAGIHLKYRAHLIIGDRQTDSSGVLKYRDLTLWIPNSANSYKTGFTPAHSLVYKVVKGLPIEQTLLAQADHQLGDLNDDLVAYYAGRIADDPAHNAGVNYWQPLGCGPYGYGDWQDCTSDWGALSDVAASALGLPTPTVNPWGQPIQVINAAPQARDSTPPYTLLLRSPTPWGTGITTTVTEPLGAAQ